MHRVLVFLLLAVALTGCKTREDIDEVEASAAGAASTESQVTANARRMRRAEAKLEDYSQLAAGIESRLKVKRTEVRDLRAEVGRRAQEIQGLKKEVGALEQEVAAQTARKAELTAASATEAELIRQAGVELQRLQKERRDWALRLEEARRIHVELADAILPILVRLPSFEPDDGPESPESRPSEAAVGEEPPADETMKEPAGK